MTTAKSTEKLITDILTELFLKLKVEAKITGITKTDEYHQVAIETPETGLLIGRHGETLNALQLLTGIILYKKTQNWQKVVLDIGGYRKMREESIKEMVTRIIKEVEETGSPVILPFLTPLERRIVHMLLSDNPTLTSESTGEGRDRRVTIKPRS